ncbi:MAG: type 4a pilus biogenesis protein PilO [Gaiellaceae bacterium]
MKLKLNARTLGLVAGLCLLLYGGVGYVLLVSPKKGEAARLDEEIAATNVELMAARAATDAQEDTQPIAVADIFRLATAMPSAPDMPGILLELSRIAEETGVRFKSITPQSSAALGEFQVVPIEVAFDGSFYALSDFLFRLRTLVSVRRGELHASGRLFSVGRVEFSESDRGFPLLAASLSLKAYVYGTDVPASEVPAPVDPSAAPPAEGEAEVPPPGGEASGSGATG